MTEMVAPVAKQVPRQRTRNTATRRRWRYSSVPMSARVGSGRAAPKEEVQRPKSVITPQLYCDARHRLPVMASTCSMASAREGSHEATGVHRRSGTVAAWPLAAWAQQQTMPVVGLLHGGSPKAFAGRMMAFQTGIDRQRVCRGPQRHD
jgi:hypothetical protein